MDYKPMTRQEEIKKEAKNKYPYIKGLPQTLAHQEIFTEGAKWADAHPDRKRELRDEATEREVAFCDAWFAENNQFPTFGHAIEWADRTMVERAIRFIEDAVCDATIETGNMARLIENFKEAMGYNELKVEN